MATFLIGWRPIKILAAALTLQWSWIYLEAQLQNNKLPLKNGTKEKECGRNPRARLSSCWSRSMRRESHTTRKRRIKASRWNFRYFVYKHEDLKNKERKWGTMLARIIGSCLLLYAIGRSTWERAVAEAPFMEPGDTGPALQLFPGSREVGNRKGPVQP